MNDLAALKIPVALRPRAGEIVEIADAFLFDRSFEPFMSADELAGGLGVAKTTMANKARRIRDVLTIGPIELELCRRETLAELTWLVDIGGFLVDARRLPPELQAEASGRG